jgi:hypothetical protein
MGLTLPLDDPQACGMVGQQRHQLVTLATLARATLMIEGATHPLPREALQGFAQGLGPLRTDRHQDRIAQPRGIDLPRHGMGRARPPGGHLHEPCGERARVLEAPPAPIPLADLAGRHHLRLTDVRPIARPGARPPGRHQTPRRPAGVRARRPHLDDLVALRWAGAQPLHGAIGGLRPQAGDQARLRRRTGIAPRNAENTHVPPHQPAPRPCGQDRRRQPLVMGRRRRGIERPPRSVAARCHHDHPCACHHQPRPLPQDRRGVAPRCQRRAVPPRQPGAGLPDRCPAWMRQRWRRLGLQARTDRGTELPQHGRRQPLQPLGDGVRTDRQRHHPQHACSGQDLLPLGDRRHPAPHQAHEERHPDGPRQEPLPPADEPRGRPRITPFQLTRGQPRRTAPRQPPWCHVVHRGQGDLRAVPKCQRGPMVRVLLRHGIPPFLRIPMIAPWTGDGFS